MRSPRLGQFVASVLVAGIAHAASFDARVEALFRPPLGERVALSPDGQRLAYTSPANGRIEIVIVNVENPGRKRTVPVEPYHDLSGNVESTPLHLRFLRWATADRLVYAPPERVVPLPPVKDKTGHSIPNPDGPLVLAPILAVDADGQQRGLVADARDFQETPADARRSLADLLRTPQELATVYKEPVHWRMPHVDVVGFLPDDRTQLIIETHGAYSMPVKHLVDLRVGNIREFGDDCPTPPGDPHVFDWFRQKVVGERQAGVRPATIWQDEDLGRLQRELAAKFPRRSVEILDWSDTHTRLLFRVTGGNDPGRIFVYQRIEDLAVEVLPCAPWLEAAKLHPTRFFEFTGNDGVALSGYLTWPAKPGANPPPLLVIFPADFPGHPQPAFDPEAQVFAELGFAVARLNHRHVAGLRPEDVPARRASLDRAAADDARATIAWIASRNPERPFDRKRVATLGRGFGAYVAARVSQLEPATFHTAVAIDTPAEWRARLSATTGAPEHLELESESPGAPPETRAAVYRRIAEFLNQRLSNYTVKIGAAKEVP